MRVNGCKFLIAALIILSPAALRAQVAVGIIPFEGDDPDKALVEMRIREALPKDGGISIIADSMMKQIIEIHEKAQSLGSAYHDISKLRVAEYIISGSVSSGKAAVKIVDINSGTEILNRFIDLKGDKEYLTRKLAKEVREMIIMQASSKGRETPDDVKPYMEVLNQLAASMPSGDEASFRFIALYSDGAYRNPKKGDKDSEEKAGLFLRVIRPNMLRAKLSYAGMESKASWMYITVIADKLGKKTKHKFGIIELENGSLAVGIYELLP